MKEIAGLEFRNARSLCLIAYYRIISIRRVRRGRVGGPAYATDLDMCILPVACEAFIVKIRCKELS